MGELLLHGFLLQPLGLQLISLYSFAKDMRLGGWPGWRGLLQKPAYGAQWQYDLLAS